MATLDFTPLFRSTIGFDQLPGLLSHALERPEAGYPPYNIEKVGEDQYRIVMAVAGFGKDGVELVQEQNRLSIRGKLKETNGKTYLHRGIATRAFERYFERLIARPAAIRAREIDEALMAEKAPPPSGS